MTYELTGYEIDAIKDKDEVDDAILFWRSSDGVNLGCGNAFKKKLVTIPLPFCVGSYTKLEQNRSRKAMKEESKKSLRKVGSR
jgi:hypothetical protein